MEQVGFLERPQDASVSTNRPTLSAWWSTHSQRVWRLSALSFVVVTCLEQIRLVARVSRYVNGDHALLWLAAHHWSRLDIREPTFFGQGYGVTFEAIPVALLHAIGVPYNVALQASLVGMAVLAWWWLAWCARHRGLQLASLTALAWPLLVSYQHFCVVDVIGTGVGRVFAALCAGLVLRERLTRRDVALAVAAGGFATAIDSASFLLAGPALLWAGLRWLRSPRLWPAACAGLAAPLAWLGLNFWFNGVHPDHLWHQGWSYEPMSYAFMQNLRYPDDLLGAQAPELFPHGALLGVVLVGALLVTLERQAWRELAAVGCVLTQLLLLFSLEKTFDTHNTLWFPAARMTLCVPMTTWFLLTITLRAALEPLQRSAWSVERLRLRTFTAVATLALLLLTAASSVTRAVHWSPRMRDFIRSGHFDPFIPIRRVQHIEELCRAVKTAADAHYTNLVAFPDNITANYACPTLQPTLVTVYPHYERRWWVLEELSSVYRERMLLWGVKPELCKQRRFRRHLRECKPIGKDAVALSFAARPPLSMLRTLGINTRPFGRDCKPSDVATCSTWREHFRTPDSMY